MIYVPNMTIKFVNKFKERIKMKLKITKKIKFIILLIYIQILSPFCHIWLLTFSMEEQIYSKIIVF